MAFKRRQFELNDKDEVIQENKVGYEEIIRRHIMNLSQQDFSQDFNSRAIYINGVEGLLSLSYPLIKDIAEKEIAEIESKEQAEINEFKQTRFAKVYKFRAKSQEVEIRHKYARDKLKVILIALREIGLLTTESTMFLE